MDTAAVDAYATDALDMDARIYVSSYSNYALLAHQPRGTESHGIYGFRFSTHTGELKRMNVSRNNTNALVEASACPNPAFMRAYGDKLYVVNERIDTNGKLFVYHMDSTTGEISLRSEADAAGRSTCYIHKDAAGKWVLLINYWDATVSVVELLDGDRLGRVTDVHRRPGYDYCERAKPDRPEHLRRRQGWSHAHCIVPAPGTTADAPTALYFVPDLGEECIHQFVLHRTSGTLSHAGCLRLAAGHGPRHMVFHPCGTLGFVVNELDSTVDVLTFDRRKADALLDSFGSAPKYTPELCLAVTQTISTLPDGFVGKSHCAEIKVGPDGRFLYVANRFSDTLAVFRIEPELDGALTRVQVVASGGKTPRHFNFDPSGRFMIVANTDNDTLCVFRIDSASGTLEHTGMSLSTPSPNYVLVVPECMTSAAPASRLGA